MKWFGQVQTKLSLIAKFRLFIDDRHIILLVQCSADVMNDSTSNIFIMLATRENMMKAWF